MAPLPSRSRRPGREIGSQCPANFSILFSLLFPLFLSHVSGWFFFFSPSVKPQPPRRGVIRFETYLSCLVYQWATTPKGTHTISLSPSLLSITALHTILLSSSFQTFKVQQLRLRSLRDQKKNTHHSIFNFQRPTQTQIAKTINKPLQGFFSLSTTALGQSLTQT